MYHIARCFAGGLRLGELLERADLRPCPCHLSLNDQDRGNGINPKCTRCTKVSLAFSAFDAFDRPALPLKLVPANLSLLPSVPHVVLHGIDSLTLETMKHSNAVATHMNPWASLRA